MTSSFEVCSNNRNDLYWSNTHKLMPVCEMCFVMSSKLILVSVGKENTLVFLFCDESLETIHEMLFTGTL